MSGKFKVPIQLVDATKDDTVTILAADDHLILKTTEGEHTILDDRTALGSIAAQDADSVAITGGTISGITPLAVADGGTGATTASGGGGGSDSWGPSDQYIDITYGATGDTYTAPADGWIYTRCNTFNVDAYIIGEVIINTGASSTVYGSGSTTYSTNKSLFLLFPVGSGYAFRMFNSNLYIDVFRFIYSKGAL